MEQLSIFKSPGTEFFHLKYAEHIQFEMCRGRLIFPIGMKSNCCDCAKTCIGCIEMQINFQPERFEELKHLIQDWDMIRKDLRHERR